MTNSAFSVNSSIVGGGALVFLGSQIASSSTSIIFTNLSSVYAAYKLVFTNVVSASNDKILELKVSTNNGSSWIGGSAYSYTQVQGQGGGSPAAGANGDGGSGAAYIGIWPSVSNTGNKGVFGEINIYGAGQDSFYQQFTTLVSGYNAAGSYWESIAGQGALTSAETVNAIQLIMSTGNITSGIFNLYGVGNAGSPISGSTFINEQYFKTTGTYTPTIGTNHVLVQAWGGGGGGGTTNNVSPGGAGGGGEYVRAYFANGSSQTITIGAGGTGGGMNNGTTATDGGNTTFGSILVSSGGTHANNGGASGGAGGTGGTIPSGGFSMAGAAGQNYTGTVIVVSWGGACFANVPKNSTLPSVAGVSGIVNTGQGGDGGLNTINGGNGGSGLMIITEYS